MLKTFFIFYSLLLSLSVKSQKTSEDLGKYLFNYFKESSISKIDSLIPTLTEMKTLAQKIGIKNDSEQYISAVNGYESELEKFHENINRIYSDSSKYNFSWERASLEKVVSIFDSLKIDNSDPNSKSAMIMRLNILFYCNSSKFRIVINDAFELNGVWKLGSNIFMMKMD